MNVKTLCVYDHIKVEVVDVPKPIYKMIEQIHVGILRWEHAFHNQLSCIIPDTYCSN